MRIKRTRRAVSEIIGTMLLLGISVSLFSVVYIFVLAVPYSPPTPSVNIICQIDDGNIVLSHYGGKALNFDSKIVLTVDGQPIDSVTAGDYLHNDFNGDGLWSMGEKVVFSYASLVLGGEQIEVNIFDIGSNSLVMAGTLQEEIGSVLSICTSVNAINPYELTSSPFDITATGPSNLDNVTLYYRWSDDNSSWGHSGETEQNAPTIDSFVETDMVAETSEFTSDSWSHTCSNYDDDVLVVCFGYENDDVTTTVISSVEYAGNSLTKAGSYLADEGANDALADIWYLLNPPTGTDIVYVNFSSTIRGGWGGSLSVYNVKQVAPKVNGSTNIGTPSSASTDITTIVDNSIIIDCVTEGCDRGGMTAGTEQTKFFDADGSAFSCNAGGSYELRTAAGTETITQSWGADGYRYAHAIVAFEPTNTTWGNGTNWAEWNNANNPDTASPWSWNFNFPNGTGYYQFYSIGQKSGLSKEIAPAFSDAICKKI